MGNWAVGGTLNIGRLEGGGCGTYSAGLSFGGMLGTLLSNVLQQTTEEYNGTTWSTVTGGDLSVAKKKVGGCGLQTAGLCSGGYTTSAVATTEEFNGTVWAVVTGGDMGSARASGGRCGTQTAALAFGGAISGENTDTAEEFNGTTWSAGGTLDSTTGTNAGAGTTTAGLSFGSWDATEEYDGTTWTAGGTLNTGRDYLAGAGLQTAALAFGGDVGEVATAVTEEYSGTAWAVGGDLNTAIYRGSGAGTLTAALSFGGSETLATASVITEQYSTSYGQHRGVAGIDGGVLFNGMTIIGDRTNGTLYVLDMDVYTDGGKPIKRTRRTQILNKERVNVTHNRIEIDFEHGVGLDVAEGEDGYDPKATLKWSDDEGHTFSDGVEVSIGEYEKYGTRAVWRALGKSRNRIYELTITEPVKIILIGAYGDLDPCNF